MLHTVLIGGHAIAGIVAFVAGCLAVRRTTAFPVYLASLTAMLAFVIGAVIVAWTGLGTAPRIVFAALIALGAYMLLRAMQARAVLRGGGASDSARYLDHVGFTLVALFDGFAIVAVLTAGGPGWLAVLTGVVGILVGHAVIVRLKAKAAAPEGALR